MFSPAARLGFAAWKAARVLAAQQHHNLPEGSALSRMGS
jgi:hypothetical protein